MKRLSAGLFSLVCLFVATGIAGTPVQPKNTSTTTGDYRQGRHFFHETEFDFGYVPQEAFVSHSFWLLNKGGDTLEIIQIKPG